MQVYYEQRINALQEENLMLTQQLEKTVETVSVLNDIVKAEMKRAATHSLSSPEGLTATSTSVTALNLDA